MDIIISQKGNTFCLNIRFIVIITLQKCFVNLCGEGIFQYYQLDRYLLISQPSLHDFSIQFEEFDKGKPSRIEIEKYYGPLVSSI